MSRDRAITRVNSLMQAERIIDQLAPLIARPTESGNPERTQELRDYLAELSVSFFAPLGFEPHFLENSIDPRFPFLLAERIESPDYETVLIYGHGDVVGGQAQEWRSDLSPFRAQMEGDRIYGRGMADNKGQHFVNLTALKAVIETCGTLGFNCKFLIEMGEEVGSCGLAQLAESFRERLAADVLIASDGPRLDAQTPLVFLGSRGSQRFELRVRLRETALHSGNWGGLVADPAIILAHAIASIVTRDGEILVPEWRPDSLTPDIKVLLENCAPVLAEREGVDSNWGEPGLSPAERAFGWNSFCMLAQITGKPDAPVGAIAPTASAFCQLRFVSGTESADILPALRRHLDKNGFGQVEIVPPKTGVAPATRASADDPWVCRVVGSILRTTDKVPHVLPNLAGTIPNAPFAETLALTTVWIPHSYAGCLQHAPNEHNLVSVLQQGAQVMTGLFYDIGHGRT